MNIPTILIALFLLVFVALAVRRLFTKGSCSGCEGCSAQSQEAKKNCSACNSLSSSGNTHTQ